jgi:hypothetical protein
MTERQKPQDSPDARADDLRAGEAESEAIEREVVQVDEQSDASTAPESRPLHESVEPADPSPFGPALPTVLALIGIVTLILVAVALLTTGRLGV